MDFEEFLWANYEVMLAYFIRECYEKRQALPQAIHRKAMQLFKEYMVVGGMPQVVKAYIKTKNFQVADREKMNILSLYRADIAKHTGALALKVESIFDAIPSELSKHEKRFRLVALSQNAKMRDYIEPFTWLQDAKFVNLCFGSTEPSMGLFINQKRTTLKCYLGDTGLLYSLAFKSLKDKNEVYRKIILGKLSVNEGMFMENMVAQMLRAQGHALFFFSNSSRESKEDRMEIDFLLPKNNITSRHNINIIEVKSGERYRLTSLHKDMKKYEVQLQEAIVLHPDNVEVKDGVTYLPVYMTGCL